MTSNLIKAVQLKLTVIFRSYLPDQTLVLRFSHPLITLTDSWWTQAAGHHQSLLGWRKDKSINKSRPRRYLLRWWTLRWKTRPRTKTGNSLSEKSSSRTHFFSVLLLFERHRQTDVNISHAFFLTVPKHWTKLTRHFYVSTSTTGHFYWNEILARKAQTEEAKWVKQLQESFAIKKEQKSKRNKQRADFQNVCLYFVLFC